VTNRPEAEARQLLAAAGEGDRASLAKLVTHLESGTEVAAALSRLIPAPAIQSQTLGVTGPPGAGKSTLINQIALTLSQTETKVAVLLIDPSSPFSGGAILGDRLRLQRVTNLKNVYVRSLASRGALGGTTSTLPRIIRLLEATGWSHIIVETVGVGQSELEIASLVDTTCVVINPGWGDAVQANKAGLMEIADVFVINKADHPSVNETRLDLEQMISAKQSLWRTPVCETIAPTGEGVEELVDTFARHFSHQLAQHKKTSLQEQRILQELKLTLRARSDHVRENWEHSGERDVDLQAILQGRLSVDDLLEKLIRKMTAGD